MSLTAGGLVRCRILVEGTVQGVGFRPFVYRVARELGLAGSVRNTPAGVLIEAAGPPQAVEGLVRALREAPPPLARVDRITTSVSCDGAEPSQGPFMQDQAAIPPRPAGAGSDAFQIVPSSESHQVRVRVPPDVALCSDCRQEVLDPCDRRYRYPFTNCTHCGPRFTIVRSLPYDRPRTTMAAFPLCEACAREYHDPADRRFHAQPIACPRCGPRAWMEDVSGGVRTDWDRAFRERIREGQIVAVKGLGGFHLACDARNPQAIRRLRVLKHRPHRPLAVMARDLATVRRTCRVRPDEARLLQDPAAPIVLLERRAAGGLPDELAPGLRTLGVMLPYTPLHLLLFTPEEGEAEAPDLLVMTSGNRSSFPIVHENESARRELAGIADAFLLHDRPIEHRADDSVVRITGGSLQFLRRSRGYVPLPFPVPLPDPGTPPPAGGATPVAAHRPGHPVALGAGGEMKNACCIIKEGQAFMGSHGGGMETEEGLDLFRHNLGALARILEATPEVIGYDPHPGYRVSRLARNLAGRHHAVQHHHAHMAAVMAENGERGPALGIVLDGTGYGTDGHLWGGELLLADLIGFRRLAHLRYLPLPGGERAIRQPWLAALAALWLQGPGRGAPARHGPLALCRRLFPGREREAGVALRLLETGLNTPRSSGAGRYFDAVAAITGTCLEATYEGQPAIELGELLDPAVVARDRRRAEGGRLAAGYPYRVRGDELDLIPAVAAAARDRLAGRPPGAIALAWHRTVAHAVTHGTLRAARATGIRAVALSGGTFHNPYLAQVVPALLRRQGLTPLLHRQVPPGDGGLALGQAVVALWRELSGRESPPSPPAGEPFSTSLP